MIADRGTIALELLEEVPELDCLLLPVGGGGLASGVSYRGQGACDRRCAWWKSNEPGADDAYRSFSSGTLTGNVPTLTPSRMDFEAR